MRIDGIKLSEGSNISNMTVASGTAFPSSPNAAELFFRTDSDVTVRGMYMYVNGGWDRLASADALSAPTGTSLPGTALAGDLFYLNSNDAAEGLYAYDGAAWNKVSNAKAVAVANANGFAGTVDNATAGAITITLTTSASGILKGNGTAISAAVAGDFPTLNQNTTGSAAKLTTARTISTTGDSTWTTTFDGSANVTGTSTLATVNVSPQTDVLRKITVNGKGLVTATSAVVVADLTSIIGINDLLPSQTAQANKFLKTDGTNTSWATPPDIPGGSTTQIQFNDGGVFAGNSNFTINKATGVVSFLVTPTINGTPVGTGNVSSVSVVSANGFAGTVATNSTTPAITISTSIVGLLKGSGTAVSNAAVGTDYSNGTAALGTGILKSTTSTGALTIAVAGDFPTLNQNTTGTASNVTGIVLPANGGTGLNALGTANQVLGINAAGTAAEYKTISPGTGVSVSHAANSVTIANTGVLSLVAGTNISVSGGSAVTVSVTGQVASAATVAITDDTATNAVVYPTWVSSTIGNLAHKVSSTKLTLNPSTGVLSSTALISKSYLEFNTNNISPQIRMRDASSGIISFYDNPDPDGGIYNYNIMMDSQLIDFRMSTVNTPYDLGVSKFSIADTGNTIAQGTSTATNFIGAGTGLTGVAAGLTIGGSAAKLTTARNIAVTGDAAWNVNFDGSANVTAALALATVNANAGAFGSSTSIPSFTTNAKGLIVAAGSNAVIAPAGTLTGTTLASNVVNSSLTSVGTLSSLTITGNTTGGAFRAAQGIPNNADSSTNGYAFGADGDSGLFAPGSGSTAGIVTVYSNNSEVARFTSNLGVSTGLNLTFTGTSSRITGDFSNASLANRAMFQTTTANSGTSIGVLPSGTSTTSNLVAFNATDPTNAGYAQLYISSTQAALSSGKSGTGTYVPLTLQTGGVDRLAIDINGNVALGGGTTTDSLLTLVPNGNSFGLSIEAASSGANTGKSTMRLLNGNYTVERLRLEGTSDTASRIGFNTGFSITNIAGTTTHIAVDGSNSSVTMNGLLVLPALFAGIELGSTTASSTPYIDFHSSGNVLDYDARILASGGNGTQGNGGLTFYTNGITMLSPLLTGVPINNVQAINTGQIGGFRNVIINGDFGVAQRGTTQTTVGYGSVDRFYFNWTSGTVTIAQQTSSVSESATGVYKCLNISGTSIVGGYMDHGIESVTTLAGKTVTLSYFYTNNSGSETGTVPSLIQTFGTGGSPSTDVGISASSDITTTVFGLQQRQLTFVIPSVSAKTIGTSGTDRLIVRIPYAGTFNKTWFGIQLEQGGVATMFERLPKSVNLSLCQRFCYVLQPADIRLAGYTTASTAVGYSTRFPVTMRTTPTAVDTLTYVYAGSVSGAGTTFLSANSYTTNASASSQYIITASAGTVVFSAEY